MSNETRLYGESDWAAERWDWFNEGRIVEPKSFCQFWRTVFLYVAIKQLLTPVRAVRRSALSGVIAIGEPMAAFGERHQTGVKVLAWGTVAIYVGGIALMLFVAAFQASSFWSSVAIGSLLSVGLFGFATYGLFKSGAARLAWEAALAAKHGICPPVRIIRTIVAK